MGGFFYGWYMKCQSGTQTVAVIPAVHGTGWNRTCSVQVITDKASWTVTFPAEAFRRTAGNIIIGNNQFGEKGISLSIREPGLTAKGKLRFGPLSPLKYGIMGPFGLAPFLECRHSVRSMQHPVCGRVEINGVRYLFRNAKGYWEGDRGRSFPGEYLWSQCFYEGGSLMAAVADIPILGFRFRGVIAAVTLHGREYRLATYLGAKASVRNGRLRIIQGDLELCARLSGKEGNSLKAPAGGRMDRVIHENAACPAHYRFRAGGQVLLDFRTDKASFEYEYPY